MSYVRITSLIDAELDRLRMARQLLSVFDGDAGEVKRSYSNQNREKVLLLPAQSETAVTENETFPADAVPVVRVKRAYRRRKSSHETAAAAAPAGALGGAVPQRPVFVPAGQIRQAQLQEQQEKASDQDAFSSAPVDAPMIEVLRQKWLQGMPS